MIQSVAENIVSFEIDSNSHTQRRAHTLLLKRMDPDSHIFVLSTLWKAANQLKLSAGSGC